MTRTWAKLLRNPEQFQGIYTMLPPLDGVFVRSVHLERRGPTAVLRIDLPAPPSGQLDRWDHAEFDFIQCHLHFLAVEEFRMSPWEPQESVDVEFFSRPVRRIQVSVGDGSIRFSCSDSLTVKHVSAYRLVSDGAAEEHLFASPLDRRRLGTTLPSYEDRSFYG